MRRYRFTCDDASYRVNIGSLDNVRLVKGQRHKCRRRPPVERMVGLEEQVEVVVETAIKCDHPNVPDLYTFFSIAGNVCGGFWNPKRVSMTTRKENAGVCIRVRLVALLMT
jgi:hypothetical protein